MNFWISEYEEIANEDVTKTILDIASILKDSSQAHVFCQRALNVVGECRVRVDGRMTASTAEAINETTEKGLTKPLCRTTRHYAANYIESHIHPSEYNEYLKQLW